MERNFLRSFNSLIYQLTLLVCLSTLWLVSAHANDPNSHRTNGTAFATVIDAASSSIDLPQWPEIAINESTIGAMSNSSEDAPYRFTFGGTPYSLYTVSVEDDEEDAVFFELSNGIETVGFFDETGLQSLHLKLLLEKALAQLMGTNQEFIEITIEHN